MSIPQSLVLEVSYSLKRRPVKQSYFLQDVEAVFKHLINDTLNCEALAGLQFLCSQYTFFRTIEKAVELELLATQAPPMPHSLAFNIHTAIVFHSAPVPAMAILKDFTQAQPNSSFGGLADNLRKFFADGNCPNTLVKLRVTFRMVDAIGSACPDGWAGEMEDTPRQSLAKVEIPINLKEGAHSCISALLDFACSLRQANWYDQRTYYQWVIRQIFQNQCGTVLMDTAIFAKILRTFAHCPGVICKVMRELGKNKVNISTLLQTSWRDIFSFFEEVLPSSKPEVVESVVDIAAILLRNNHQFICLVWYHDGLMACLEKALELAKESTLLAVLRIYRKLIISQHYPKVAHRIQECHVAEAIFKVFQWKTSGGKLISNLSVVREGLSLIKDIMDFEKKHIKFQQVAMAAFIEGLQKQSQCEILQEIYSKWKEDPYIRAISMSILSQRFIKIQGEIKSMAVLTHN